MANEKSMSPRVAYILLMAQIGKEPKSCFKHGDYYIFDCSTENNEKISTSFFAVASDGKAMPYSPYGDGIVNFEKFVESAKNKLPFK